MVKNGRKCSRWRLNKWCLKSVFTLTVSTDINDLVLNCQPGQEIFPFSSSTQNPRYDTHNGRLIKTGLFSSNKMTNHPIIQFKRALFVKSIARLVKYLAPPSVLCMLPKFSSVRPFNSSFVEEQVRKVLMHNVEELRSSSCNGF